MTRPNTRNKNKRNKGDDRKDSSSEILRKIHLTGQICPDDLSIFYSLWKPFCHGCRVNNNESPNCFCGLIPPNGARKTGLWQKMSDIIETLGPDPCKDLRTPTEVPAGLTNLGATCYANSILQCLYMNTSLRDGIFSVEPDILKQHPVLDQLARLFAQLHSSRRAFVDSAPFIKALEIDNGVQQDSHEFLTLFLSLLERSLSFSKTSQRIVQGLFQGTVSHETRCSVCQNKSYASSKKEGFYGLELNIKGFDNLEESLDDYLSKEELHGENQYLCESCGTRVNATRQIILHSLPSVLNFQLKRYIFFSKTTTRKKLTSAFSFPKQLSMRKRLDEPSESDVMYDLSAILIHKGTAVNSGHYVVHIKDENTGQWWEFDDENVSNLGRHPFGEASNSSAKSETTPQINSCEEGQSVSNGNQCDTFQETCSHVSDAISSEIYSSTDAYMLMYTQVSKDEICAGSCKTSITGFVTKGCPLPPHFSEEIDRLNTSYINSCDEYRLKMDGQVTNITERRQEVKSILSEAPVRTLEGPFFWISAGWLRQWADCITPLCIDNSPIQCLHGKLSVSNVTSMKRLSCTSWTKLHHKYGGGPTLSNDDYCIDCLMDEAKNTVCADDYRGKRDSLRQLAEESLAGHCSVGTPYYVSRSWLVQWVRKRNVDSPCGADVGPTASLRCPHGCLLPEKAAGARRVLVPEELWSFFIDNANLVKPDDLLGSSAFPADCEVCDICNQDLTNDASMADYIRASKLQQRQNHEKLLQGKGFELSYASKYFLVPSPWLVDWRSFILSTGKNMLSSAGLENLQIIMDSLICEKHSRLLERPPEIVCKRGVIFQKPSSTDGLAIITETDWKLFCEEWNASEDKGISVEVVSDSSPRSNLVGSAVKMPINDSEMLHCSNEELNDKLEAGKIHARTFPEVCEDCIGERESSDLIRKLNYCDEDICVYLVCGKEAPRYVLEASADADRGRRMSKRCRKTSFGNYVNLKVSGSNSIYQLKMMIWEAFGIVKENQKLHKGLVEIEGDHDTLADKNIYPKDILWVRDLEIHENRDIADELLEQKMEPQRAEEGFRGTLLTSDVLVQESYSG